VIKEESL